MCDDDWVVVDELVNLYFTYSQGQLGSVPCLLRVAVLKRLLRVRNLGLHLELYRAAFPKINGVVKSTEDGKANSVSSVQFSRSVMSDSLRPQESQHARPPCPSPTPGIHSDSCPLSQ